MRLAARDSAILFVQDGSLTRCIRARGQCRERHEYSTRINRMLTPYVVDLLSRGMSVVLDFPGNTRNQRAWFREMIDRAAVDHELHYVDTPDDICKAQLEARSRHLPAGTPWTTDADFELISSHFKAPAEDERFNVIRHHRSTT